MAKIYKINIQTMLGGILVGVGRYSEESERLNAIAKESIEQYVAEQKGLPLDKRHIPPYFEIIDTDAQVESIEDKLDQKAEGYMSMKHDALIDLAKQRGLEVKGNMSNKTLIEILTADDEKVLTNESESAYGFKSVEEFDALDDDEKVEYLDSIYTTPDGVSGEEEEAYYKALGEIVTAYSGLSLGEETVEKVKEILDYCNS